MCPTSTMSYSVDLNNDDIIKTIYVVEFKNSLPDSLIRSIDQ